jgi:pimeloyl-ACP methyl ester carboxylesterase
MASQGIAASGDDVYTRPGQIFRASDGTRLNFYCMGSGSPTVVFDSPFLDWSPIWSIVQPKVAAFTRACSYDRAGAGFSGPAATPVTLERIATELKSALHAGGVDGPYILVASANGGNHIRAFADLFPKDVAGLILLDADATDMDTADNRRDDDENIEWLVPRMAACRDAIRAGNAEATMPLPPGRPPFACTGLFFRGLPEVSWSPELNAKMLDLGRHNVAMWDADISEAENIPADETWLQLHQRDMVDRPIRVLTSTHHGIHDLAKPPPMSIDQLKYQYEKALAQSRWLALSTDAKQIFVPKSGEYIQFDDPDTVVNTIREIYEKTKTAR